MGGAVITPLDGYLAGRLAEARRRDALRLLQEARLVGLSKPLRWGSSAPTIGLHSRRAGPRREEAGRISDVAAG
jgi:hypothetical protein